MPKVKVTEQKIQTPQKPVEQKVVVFRLFECVVHLEVALAELKKVGIFPGPEAKATEAKKLHTQAVANIEALYRQYLTVWGELPKP